MICENDYCIYNKDDTCVLDCIDLNALGHCNACIIVSLNKDLLELEKEKQRNELEEATPAD